MLAVVHVGLAGITNTPELALDESEARTLATATIPVLEQFDFTPDPRLTAVLGLVMASAQVYGPRVYLIRARLRAEELARAENAKRVYDSPGFVPGANGVN